MKFKGVLSFLSVLAALLIPVTSLAQTVTTFQGGVSLFTLQPATATATSPVTRLPNFSTSGVLTITYSGITGSPSGCTIALASQGNNSTTPTAAIATVTLSPANGVVTALVSASVPAADNLVATYACSSTYPTAGLITVSFSPAGSANADPCGPSASKSSVPLAITTATTTQLVALSAGKKVYVCAVDASLGLSDTLKLEYGTGSACGTGTTALTGAIASDTAVIQVLAANPSGTLVTAPAGNALCAVSTGTGGIQGVLTYVQQ